MKGEPTPYQSKALEVLEAARTARDQEIHARVTAGLDTLLSTPEEVRPNLSVILAQETNALVKRMRHLARYRYLGGSAILMQVDREVDDSRPLRKLRITTPLLAATEPEPFMDSSTGDAVVRDGYVFTIPGEGLGEVQDGKLTISHCITDSQHGIQEVVDQYKIWSYGSNNTQVLHGSPDDIESYQWAQYWRGDLAPHRKLECSPDDYEAPIGLIMQARQELASSRKGAFGALVNSAFSLLVQGPFAPQSE